MGICSRLFFNQNFFMDTLKLEELEIYQLSLEIGEDGWTIVNKWNYFSKSTVGTQFVEAADCISANIAEGYGRYFKRPENVLLL